MKFYEGESILNNFERGLCYTYYCKATKEFFECSGKTLSACRVKRNRWVLKSENRW